MSDWHAAYKERYKKLKEEGLPFFPYTVFKDTLMAVLVLALLCFLAHHFGAKLEDVADPTDTTYNPRPEWYFLFLFQSLKFFPGSLEAVAAVVMPGVIVTALLLLPFIDRGPKRHPLERPLVTGAGVLALMGWGWLTWAGWHSPMTNPSTPRDPQVTRGERLYAQLNCAYCHAIRGKGGRVGPDLETAFEKHDEAWIRKHFQDPQALSPGTRMPKLNLLDDEVDALVAYLKSVGTGGAFTPEAPKLFAENCATCHTIDGKGGDVGPNLSMIGSARSKDFIKNYVMDPSKSNPNSSMPGFAGQLTDVQIEDVARYLASHH
ncbi:MAG: c-type cytochrome [Elusimicrobia bacterium]|nr:c-type cytochrome [Elusimicrobiota bacterium]